jgi:ketosteroid isomerase-like protein
VSENLDLVRSIYADWERGDFSAAPWAHPEIEFVAPEGPNQGNWTGALAMASAWGEHLSAYVDIRAEPEEYRELEDGRVLVLQNWRGRGRTSALSVDQISTKSAVVFHIREGKVTRLVGYWNRERGLADLGLKE